MYRSTFYETSKITKLAKSELLFTNGCGIAYSQYAAMNALGEELVKEANKTIVENGGEPIDFKKEETKPVPTVIVDD